MELDSFLASPRWEILRIISERPSSPIEIAEKTKTTVSFVSQQLKLLEAAQIVHKEKTGAFEKGKPRNLFSISKDVFYLIVLTNGFGDKRTLQLDSYQKSILRIWFLENKFLQAFLEELLYRIKSSFNLIDAIFIDLTKISPSIIIFLDDKKTQQVIDAFFKKSEEKIKLEFFSISDLGKLNLSSFFSIYQSPIFLKRNIEMKGGVKNEKTN